MPKKKKLAPWIFGDGPEPIPADLTVDQKRHISASAGIVFSARDWKNIVTSKIE
jgi:lysyl-tRNA synthetase class I